MLRVFKLESKSNSSESETLFFIANVTSQSSLRKRLYVSPETSNSGKISCCTLEIFESFHLVPNSSVSARSSLCCSALAVPPQLLGIYKVNTSTELIFAKNNSGVLAH